MNTISLLVYAPRKLFGALAGIGNYALFMSSVFGSVGEIRSFRAPLFRQMVRIGVGSLPIVMLASAFAGIVLTVQTAYQLESTILTPDTIGAAVVPTLMLEMAALVPGLVLASRIGASIAAELGTMRVTEQIDALESMGMNSAAYLVLPRVVAGTLMFPSIYISSVLISVIAGGYAGEYLGYLSFEQFIQGARIYFQPFDLYYGMTKMLSFGFLITSLACWKGFTTSGGADGVGRSATSSVVTSCVNILVADYVVAALLL